MAFAQLDPQLSHQMKWPILTIWIWNVLSMGLQNKTQIPNNWCSKQRKLFRGAQSFVPYYLEIWSWPVHLLELDASKILQNFLRYVSFSNIREILELGFHLKMWQVVESVQYLSWRNTAQFSKGGEGAKSSISKMSFWYLLAMFVSRAGSLLCLTNQIRICRIYWQ